MEARSLVMITMPLAAWGATDDGEDWEADDERFVDEEENLGEVEQAAVNCSAVRKNWNDGSITINAYKGNAACNAYSNYWKNWSTGKYYTGVKWECVEFARRYRCKRWGAVSILLLEPRIFVEFPSSQNYFYGDNVKKKKGDMMVLKPGKCGSSSTYGHVGIIAQKSGPGEFKVWDQGDSITDGQPNYYDSSCAIRPLNRSTGASPN